MSKIGDKRTGKEFVVIPKVLSLGLKDTTVWFKSIEYEETYQNVGYNYDSEYGCEGYKDCWVRSYNGLGYQNWEQTTSLRIALFFVMSVVLSSLYKFAFGN